MKTIKFRIGKTYQDAITGDKCLVVRRRLYDYGTHTAQMVWFQRNSEYNLSYVRVYEKNGIEYVDRSKFFTCEEAFGFTANDLCDRYDSGKRVEVYCIDERHLPIDKPYQAEPNEFFATWENDDIKLYHIDGVNYYDKLFVEF